VLQQPTRPSQSGLPAVERQFVDREEPLAIFQTVLKEPQTKPIVLVFHGGAGTGKSRLRRELAKLADSRQNTADRGGATATLDFDVPVHRQPDAALLHLRTSIGTPGGTAGRESGDSPSEREDARYSPRFRGTVPVMFPSFDIAYAVLWQKAHPDTALRSEEGGERREEAQIQNDERGILEPNSLIARLLDDSGKLPTIGLIPKISKLLAASLESSNPRTLESFLIDWWQRRGERELEDLPQMEPAAIVEQLPRLWASDMKDALRAESRESGVGSSPPGNDSPLSTPHSLRMVLFVDSYEKLWGIGDEGRRSTDEVQKTDAWVRELVKQLPEVLWVISGRQKLRWEEAEKEWAGVLNQHELGPLPEQSARQFLSGCGITDEPIQDAIAKGSQGLPHYLNLAVDTFQEIEQSGQRAASTGSSPSSSQAGTEESAKSERRAPSLRMESPEELFTQFIRHLDQPEIATLEVLSASRYWNYGLFEHLLTEYQTGYPLESYDDLSRFSFVGEGAAPETRTMHDLMREALQEHQAPELRKRVHLFLHEYYAKQLEGLDVKGITEKDKAALTEAFYHGRQAKSAEELWSWLKAARDVFTKAGQHRLLTPLLREMVQALENELGRNHADTATALWYLAWNLEGFGHGDEAEPLLRRALATLEKELGQGHPLVLQCLHEFGNLLINWARYDEAEVLFRRAVGVYDKNPDKSVDAGMRALVDLADVLWRKGQSAESEVQFRRALATAEDDRRPDSWWLVTTLGGLACTLRDQRRNAEAEPLLRRALAIAENVRSADRYPVGTTAGHLAWVLHDLGRYAECVPLRQLSCKIKEEILGADHWMTAVSVSNLGGALLRLGRYAEAEARFRRALAAHDKWMGFDHPDTIRMTVNLASALTRQGNYGEAEPIILNAIATCEKKLGPDNPVTASALFWAGIIYSDQGRYAEAEGFLPRALDIQTTKRGHEHPNTLAYIDALASLDDLRGKHAEAESLYRDVLEKRTRALGSEHPDVAETADNLAGLCFRDGRYAEAEALYRRALTVREKVFGPESPFVAGTLDGLAKVCEQTNRAAEAQELSARAKAIRDKAAAAAQAQAPSEKTAGSSQ